MADEHPADQLLETIKGLFTGDAIKQSIRDAWDRTTGNSSQPDSKPAQQADAGMVAAANQSFRDAANKAALSDAQAAKIRAKAKMAGR